MHNTWIYQNIINTVGFVFGVLVVVIVGVILLISSLNEKRP